MKTTVQSAKCKVQRFILCMMLFTLQVHALSASELPLSSGDSAFRRGNFLKAVERWQADAEKFRKSGQTSAEIDALIRMSEAYRLAGYYPKAIETIGAADTLARTGGSNAQKAKIAGIYAILYQFGHEPEKAKESVKTGIQLVQRMPDSDLPAFLKYCEGEVLSAQKDEEAALSAYLDSAKLSEGKNPELCAKSLIRAAAVCRKIGKNQDTLLNKAIEHIRSLGDSHEKIYLLIAAAELSDSDVSLLISAKEISEKIGDLRALSYSLGHISKVYEQQKCYDESLASARKAAFVAQEVDSPEILYRWQWQIGRLLKLAGDRNGAISSYRLAIRNLEAIRQDMSLGCRKGSCLSFRDIVGPIYFDLADLLLQRSAVLTEQKQIEDDLKEARGVIEQLKNFELQDYFQDECVTSLHLRNSSIDQFYNTNAAAIYPILLPDRTELLLTLPDRIKRFTVALKADELTEMIRVFRAKLENPYSRFLRNARQLYDYLIRPMEEELGRGNIKTLVFVPDGPLRTVPMSSLHDGEKFLIEKYAIAVTPGLTLTDPKPLERRQVKLLLSGLTESVQGFSPLPNVNYELQAVHALYESNILRDKTFTVVGMEQAFKSIPYSIVHIASHGQFDNDPKKTFLLTHDDKLTMDKLETLIRLSEFRKEPVELLTLSACQTAVGDDRAALGLAGVAVKAGVRSALATLWFIDDASTSRLVTEFYQSIRNPRISKAESLRQAQIKLLKTSEFGHPAYWAPFLLIGGWM